MAKRGLPDNYMVREITIMCKIDRHTRQSAFKVWERTGVSGTDPQRNLLYDGPDWAHAVRVVERQTEHIEDDLLPR